MLTYSEDRKEKILVQTHTCTHTSLLWCSKEPPAGHVPLHWFCSSTIPTKQAITCQQKVPEPPPVSLKSPNHLVQSQTAFRGSRMMKPTSVDMHRDCLLRYRNDHPVVTWRLEVYPALLTPLSSTHKITGGRCFFLGRKGLFLS